MEGALALLAFFFVIVVPLIAIAALVRVNKIVRTVGDLAAQGDRLATLDVRLGAMDRKLDRLLAGPAVAPVAAPPSTSIPPGTPAPSAAPSPSAPPRPTAPPPPPPPSSPIVSPEGIPQGVVPGMPRPAAPHASPASASASAPGAAGAHASVRSGPSFTAPLTPPSSLPSIAKTGSDVEEMIAGHWLNYVGILALAIAVAFFLKYAFDNNWIGPSGRVAIGLGMGTGLFVVSHWLLSRGYTYFSEGLAGLGSFVLYLSIWAGWHYYHLFPQNTAFLVMILITAAIFGVAIARDSERVAFLALIGGVLTPIMVSTGRNEEAALFSYIAVLSAGVLWIAFQRKWQSLPPVQFVATIFYFWGWYNEFYRRAELNDTLFFATVFFILFAALPMVRSLRGERFSQLEILIVVANACQYLVALRQMLWPDERWELTAALVALAAVHFVVAQGVPKRDAEAARIARLLYIGLAVSFATLAVPAGLDDEWITISWAAEGALLIWYGLRIRSGKLRAVGLILFGAVGVRLLAYPIHASQVFLLNARFLTQSLSAAAYLAAFLLARESDEELSGQEAKTYYFLAIAANVLFLFALSQEVWNFYGRTALAMDRALAQQLALSVLWVVYALALMVLGVRLKSAALRWQALILLGVAIVKVFFFDLSFLTRFYRIVSFFVLGLVLLLVSFFYQRRSAKT